MRSAIETDSTETKLFGLDHLRALAIILVFFFHYQVAFKHPAWTETIGSFGWVGVDLFFVLSGYLIAAQLFNKVSEGKKISLKEFYIKRFFRIIPAYLLVVAVYFSLPSFREKEALPPLWRFLTFTQNFGLDPKTSALFRMHGRSAWRNNSTCCFR
jgi:peptidoglycan/LPS O-acetylase OafA/YrhL